MTDIRYKVGRRLVGRALTDEECTLIAMRLQDHTQTQVGKVIGRHQVQVSEMERALRAESEDFVDREKAELARPVEAQTLASVIDQVRRLLSELEAAHVAIEPLTPVLSFGTG